MGHRIVFSQVALNVTNTAVFSQQFAVGDLDHITFSVYCTGFSAPGGTGRFRVERAEPDGQTNALFPADRTFNGPGKVVSGTMGIGTNINEDFGNLITVSLLLDVAGSYTVNISLQGKAHG